MKKVYHNLLSDGKVSEQDTLFFINCIKAGLTTIVKRNG